MVALFQSYTPDGVIQFDSDLSTYGFAAKGTVSAVTTYIATYPYRIATVNVASATYPLIFLKGARPFHLLSVYRSGNTWEFKYLTTTSGTASYTFTYYVFDQMTAPGSFGFELYNANGQRTFTTNQPPLHLVHVGAASTGNWATQPLYTVSIPAMSGRTCAVMLSGARVHSEDISGNGIGGYMECIRDLSTGVEISWQEEWFAYYDGIVGNASYPQGGQSTIIVADVTGL